MACLALGNFTRKLPQVFKFNSSFHLFHILFQVFIYILWLVFTQASRMLCSQFRWSVKLPTNIYIYKNKLSVCGSVDGSGDVMFVRI